MGCTWEQLGLIGNEKLAKTAYAKKWREIEAKKTEIATGIALKVT